MTSAVRCLCRSSVNVAGVQQLSLNVIGSTNSTAGDSAVWAEARLISTANFSQHQISPYTLSWQVSENGSVLSTVTSDSFSFAYLAPGVYTVGLTVTDSNGNTATSSSTVTVILPRRLRRAGQAGYAQHREPGSALTVARARMSLAMGPRIRRSRPSPPAVSRILRGPPAPQIPGRSQNAGIAGRVAAAWASPTSFTVQANFTDGTAARPRALRSRLG